MKKEEEEEKKRSRKTGGSFSSDSLFLWVSICAKMKKVEEEGKTKDALGSLVKLRYPSS